jgi:ATP synthase mitochondrial F1 complex assembly factor 1
VQAVPRETGHFMLVVQFQKPNYFLWAYLAEYQQNPTAATPWLTGTIFTEYSDEKNVTLVRADVVNQANLSKHDATQILESLVYSYEHDYETVRAMNHEPTAFDVDDTVSRMTARWKHLN